MKAGIVSTISAVVLATSIPGSAQVAKPEEKGASDGSVAVPAFVLPFSAYASPEARAEMENKAARIQSLRTPEALAEMAKAADPMTGRRQVTDRLHFMPSLEAQRRRYAVNMTSSKMDGVEVQIFEPREGVSAANKNRVLINLHGGGFVLGWPLVSQIESIPISATGKIKVVSVNYGMFPETRFPKGSQDVASVYKQLLKSYKPSQIGIYGCSAGGLLTSEAMAWFQKEKLPAPAAIAILSAALDPNFQGDSAYIGPQLGSVLPAPKSVEMDRTTYFAGADAGDPLVSPGQHPGVIAQYPPTLFGTGTRAGDMSAATHAHLTLLKAGVESQLLLWDGLDHCFLYNPDMPESREAYSLIANFFETHMGKDGN